MLVARARTTRWTVLTAVLAGSLALAGCSGGSGVGQGGGDAQRNADAKTVSLTIASNAVSGGKNAEEADWITDYVIPEFEKRMKAKGVKAQVEFQPSGVDDEQYKTKISLDLKSRSGADVIAIDGIWVGEFAEAGYILPLEETVGDSATSWDGWTQIPDNVAALMEYDGKRYGVPAGTDGRVLFYNKDLFARAGLPRDWQPTSWDEVIAAGQKLKVLDGVTPIQLNAGTAMGEATTMQGVLPLLSGAGTSVHEDGRWLGNTPQLREVLGIYDRIYSSGLGDPKLQQEAKGRDKSFAEFAAGRIGILEEGDYFWRSVVEPKAGIAPMPDRDDVVGYAKIPALGRGKGIRGQDFVSMSGGGGRVVNPSTRYPQQAWELLAFMNSAEATRKALAGQVRITQRQDVNEEVLKGDPFLSYIADEVLPITTYRPPLAAYTQVSVALQEATANVVSGMSPAEAAKRYEAQVRKAVGDKVRSG